MLQNTFPQQQSKKKSHAVGDKLCYRCIRFRE
jgi:hypothetical protein